MTTKEQLNKLQVIIGELMVFYAELAGDLPQLRFVRAGETQNFNPGTGSRPEREEKVIPFPFSAQAEENKNEIAQSSEEDEMRKLKYGNGSIRQCCRKLKNGNVRRFWQGRIYNEDGKQISVYGSTKEECYKKLLDLRKKSAAIAPKKQKISTERHFVFFADWLDEWMKQFKEGKLRGDYYKQLCHRVEIVKNALGKLRLARIQPLELLRFFNSLPKINSTVKFYDIVNGSLQKAEDFGIIKHNPCRAVERPSYEKQKRRAFELKEQSAIMEALAPRYSALFFFLCSTGLRIGEFLSLKADDIDFNRQCIIVDSSLSSRTGEDGKPKTAASVRKIYFDEALFATFKIEELGTFTYDGIKKAFERVYKKLDIKGISATHSCRHTFASMLYAVGVPDKVIQSQLGHTAVSTTMDIYTDILLQGDSPIYVYISRLKKTLSTIYFWEKK